VAFLMVLMMAWMGCSACFYGVLSSLALDNLFVIKQLNILFLCVKVVFV
jgi:hypothetical protein